VTSPVLERVMGLTEFEGLTGVLREATSNQAHEP
jgi:hypothetical protein